MAAATAISKIVEFPLSGGKLEIWAFTLDLASIAANAQDTSTVAVPGARAGDPVWMVSQDLANHLIPAGAKVTADDVVSVYHSNGYDATTAIDQTSKTYHLAIIKRAVGS